jgi:hypothetical protein
MAHASHGLVLAPVSTYASASPSATCAPFSPALPIGRTSRAPREASALSSTPLRREREATIRAWARSAVALTRTGRRRQPPNRVAKRRARRRPSTSYRARERRPRQPERCANGHRLGTAAHGDRGGARVGGRVQDRHGVVAAVGDVDERKGVGGSRPQRDQAQEEPTNRARQARPRSGWSRGPAAETGRHQGFTARAGVYTSGSQPAGWDSVHQVTAARWPRPGGVRTSATSVRTRRWRYGQR